ncbi:xylulokinase [Antricoccus suffuscus]|uniref:Xylulokinase n=1 Tax=Antricoccus suffuscus TaxID=1629062 RepID=A0A2T0ZW04_9ACTN|nr:FGGY family carbohydrate kinase [Antricoccus suffuscus]PRZ40474.1 xylulokinase [Antricoccus suffuscus]
MSVACLDIGTSAVKAALIGPDGVVLATGTAPYPTRRAPGGVVEQSPEDWWNACRTAIAQCGPLAGEARALSVTGQMQDLILLDEGTVVRDALLYSDLRASAEHVELAANMPDWDDCAGTVQDQSNVAAKLLWLTRHEPDHIARTSHIVFGPAGFVLQRCGAGTLCDVTTASPTGLLDLKKRDWNWDLVDACGVQRDVMPALVSDTGVVGALSGAAAAELGLPQGIALVCPPGDAGAATDGLVGDVPGAAYLYLGTTGWLAKISAPSETLAAHPSLHRLALPGWSTLGIAAVLHAGAAADWALRTFLNGRSFGDADALVPVDRASGLLCLPGLAGERSPVRDANARGAFVGAGPDTGAEDFYLATLEGVAFAFRHAADELGVGSGVLPVVGGGARSTAWQQVLADVLERPIAPSPEADAGTHAAARAAYRAMGERVPDPIAVSLDPVSRVNPGPRSARYRRLAPVHRNLYGTLAETFRHLADATSPERKDPGHA